MTEALIHEMIFRTAERHPFRPAFWIRNDDRFDELSYKELATGVISVAGGLVELGLKPGDRVGIYADNSPEWSIAYLAILTVGGVVVPIDVQLKYLELRSIIAKADMKYLFAAGSRLSDLDDLKALAPPHPEVIPLTGSAEHDLSLDKLRELGVDREFTAPRIDSDQMSVLLFTSGTSGESKGVMLSHKNIVSDVQACLQQIAISPEDRMLSLLPLHHTFEATAGFLLPLFAGASIAHVKSLKSQQVMANIKSLKITMMCAVPLLYEKMYFNIKRALAKEKRIKRAYVAIGQTIASFTSRAFKWSLGRRLFKPLRERGGLDSISLFISGGAAINPEISRFFCNLGINLIQGYGLTETSPVISVNTVSHNRYASVGRPLPGVSIAINDVDEDGRGEITVKGDMVMLGYFNNEKATEAVMRDGYFLTGDLGYLDRAGFLYITGRKKNVIVSPAGKNIYPEEIEAALDMSPSILESAVLPRPRGTGEEPVAVVVPDMEMIAAEHEGRQLSDAEIQEIVTAEVEEVSARFADYKRLKDVIVLMEELPKTSTRKIKRYILIDALQKMGRL